MDDTRNVACRNALLETVMICRLCPFGAARQRTKYSEKNVYQEVRTAATLQEDTERRKDNSEDDLDDVAT